MFVIFVREPANFRVQKISEHTAADISLHVMVIFLRTVFVQIKKKKGAAFDYIYARCT